MAYDDIEQSVDQGEPVTLFEFLYGDTMGDAYRYAATLSPNTDTIVAAGMQWAPFQIRHGDITNSGNLDRAKLKVSMSIRAEIAELFKVAPPSRPVRLRIWRGHVADGDYRMIWSGRVLDAEWDGPEVTFSAEPLATSLRRIGLRRFYQYGCSHVLYGPECKASRAANTGAGRVVGSNDLRHVDVQIERTPIPLVAGHLIGGVLRLTLADGREALRTITSAQETGSNRFSIHLISALVGISSGLAVDVSRGCEHNFQTCRDRFRNTPNFGGCPNIPTKNPFTANSF